MRLTGGNRGFGIESVLSAGSERGVSWSFELNYCMVMVDVEWQGLRWVTRREVISNYKVSEPLGENRSLTSLSYSSARSGRVD